MLQAYQYNRKKKEAKIQLPNPMQDYPLDFKEKSILLINKCPMNWHHGTLCYYFQSQLAMWQECNKKREHEVATTTTTYEISTDPMGTFKIL